MVNAYLEYENGTVANLTASRISHTKFRKLRVFEKDRYHSIDFLNRGLYSAEIIENSGTSTIKTDERTSLPGESLKTELENFFLAIRGEDNIGVTGWEGYEALKLAEAITEKMRFPAS